MNQIINSFAQETTPNRGQRRLSRQILRKALKPRLNRLAIGVGCLAIASSVIAADATTTTTLTTTTASTPVTDSVPTPNAPSTAGTASLGESLALSIGGGASYDAEGLRVRLPKIPVYGKKTAASVGEAIAEVQASAPIQYSTPSGSTNGNNATSNDVTLVGSTAEVPVKLHNVAQGSNATDAVNVKQLNDGLQSNVLLINQLRSDVDVMRSDLMGASAGAVAMAGLPQAVIPGKSLASMALGSIGGESAVAMGLSSVTDGGTVFKLQASTTTRKQTGISVGVGFHF